MKLYKRLGMVMAVAMLTQVAVPIYAQVEQMAVQAKSTNKVSSEVANKIPNGGFETIANNKPANFDIDSGKASITVETDAPYMGSSAMKITASEETKVVLGTSKSISVGDGVYGVTIHVKTEDMNGKLWIDMKQNKTDNVNLTEVIDINVGPTTDGWRQIDVLFDGINVLRTVDFDINFEGTGTVWIDELRFYNASRINEIQLSDMTIDLANVDYNQPIKMAHTIAPSDARDQRLMWHTSDSSILEITQEGYLIPKKAGTVEVEALTKDHHRKAKATVTLTGEVSANQIVKIGDITLPQELTLEAGSGGKLDAVIAPANYTHKELTWDSSNPEVITVMNDGRLSAKQAGTATVTVTDSYGASAVVPVTVTEKIDNKFDQVRDEWNLKIRKRLTAADYDKQVDEYWSQMDTDSSRLYLWSDITTDYRMGVPLGDKVISRLVVMATATTLPDSKYYQHDGLQADIADAITWINKEYLGKEHELYRKSWHWTIGIPKQMADLYMLTYDYLSQEEIQDGMEFVAYEASPSGIGGFSAANLVDAAKSVIGAFALLEDEAQITKHLEMALGELKYVSKGNGFYEDGSFVEHSNIAYTGSYGTVLLNGIGDLVEIFEGTSFDIGGHLGMMTLYKILQESYLPLISFGSFMDNTRGRAISRPGDGDHGEAHVVVSAMIKAGYAAPEPYHTALLSQAKRIVLEDKEHYDTMFNPYVKPNVDKLMADTSILPASPYIYSHEFGGMNRSIHHTENFGVGISKSSKRIATFEHLNGENKKGWNTGYGMTNIYNADVNQYKEGYWATIDPYRLPGTTADTGVRESSHAQDGDGEGTTGNNWAGGVTLRDTFATSGMDMRTRRKAGSTLTANKSWFMFDDEVIAMGSAINSTDDRNAETIVENRKIDLEGSNKLTINGVEQVAKLGDTAHVSGVEWAHLEGRVVGADIGYYFPAQAELNLIKEQRAGNYKAVNDGRDEEHTNSFTTMVINHGKAPKGEKYAYALIPGATADEMESYAKAPNFVVVENQETIHAVRHLKHNILAANFYLDQPQQVEYLRVDGDAAVMIQEGEDYLELAVSDPTMERDHVVVDLVGKTYTQVLKSNPNVNVEQTEAGIRLTIDTSGSFSQSYEVKLGTTPVVVEGPHVTMTTTSSAITAGDTFEMIVGIEDTKTLVYAQDMDIAYDNNLFELIKVEAILPTMVVETAKEDGKERVLLATEGGLAPSIEAVKLIFRAKGITNESQGTIAIQTAKFGVINGGTSETIEGAGTKQTLTVKPRAEIEIDKTELNNTIQEAQTLIDQAVVGNEIGEYPQTAIDALKTAIKEAQQVANESMDRLQINEQTVALRAAIETFKVSQTKGTDEDINQDNKVNVADLALVAYYYQAQAGGPEWEQAKQVDINKDGRVDILDLTIVAKKILSK